jgi:hypothetical protein
LDTQVQHLPEFQAMAARNAAGGGGAENFDAEYQV